MRSASCALRTSSTPARSSAARRAAPRPPPTTRSRAPPRSVRRIRTSGPGTWRRSPRTLRPARTSESGPHRRTGPPPRARPARRSWTLKWGLARHASKSDRPGASRRTDGLAVAPPGSRTIDRGRSLAGCAVLARLQPPEPHDRSGEPRRPLSFVAAATTFHVEHDGDRAQGGGAAHGDVLAPRPTACRRARRLSGGVSGPLLVVRRRPSPSGVGRRGERDLAPARDGRRSRAAAADERGATGPWRVSGWCGAGGSGPSPPAEDRPRGAVGFAPTPVRSGGAGRAPAPATTSSSRSAAAPPPPVDEVPGRRRPAGRGVRGSCRPP